MRLLFLCRAAGKRSVSVSMQHLIQMLVDEQTIRPYSPAQAFSKSIRESDLSVKILGKGNESTGETPCTAFIALKTAKFTACCERNHNTSN